MEQVWNNQRIEEIDDLFETGFEFNYSNVVFTHTDQLKKVINEWLIGFPDIHYTVDEYLCIEDKVVTRWHGHGTHTGPFHGIGATGKEFHYSGCALFDLNNSNKKNFFLYGWLFGYGYFVTNIYWIAISLTFDKDFNFLVPLAIVLVPAFLSLFYGIFTLIFYIFNFNNLSWFSFSN